ncbi:caspase domain-containing protein [Mycena galopus ATCC 62051]|nr:caspase domain-containing protein [Mycena galopus ATCC 62051]
MPLPSFSSSSGGRTNSKYDHCTFIIDKVGLLPRRDAEKFAKETEWSKGNMALCGPLGEHVKIIVGFCRLPGLKPPGLSETQLWNVNLASVVEEVLPPDFDLHRYITHVNRDETTPAESPPLPNGRDSIFAVVIGINESIPQYQAHSWLDGAMNDARAFHKFLMEDLRVPPRNIVLLENTHATRAKILSTIESHLRDNPDIPDHGEVTILLYFAGHGSSVAAPEDVIAPNGQIEVMCPVDDSTTNEAGEEVHAIPDYVLNRLLGEIAEKKGHKIVVIMDCCHSGGMDRDIETTARSVTSAARSILLDLDSNFWKGKDEAVPYRRKSLSSFALLAACGADEKAREIEKPDGTHGGRFTTALIPLLQKAPLEHTTFAELMGQQELKELGGQRPRCVGGRINQPILNSNRPAGGQHSVLLTPLPGTETPNSPQLFRVGMGTLMGVRRGTEFKAYNGKEFLCVLVAKSVRVNHSILGGESTPPFDIPQWSRAVVSNWKGSLARIFAPDDLPYKAELFPTSSAPPQKYIRAGALEDADISVHSEGNETVVVLETTKHENRFGRKGEPTHLAEFIQGAAHFNYFLKCCNETDRIEGVGVEVHQLQGEYPSCKPQDEKVGNLVKDGQVHLVSEKGVKYGLKIRNTSPEDIFPYLFYFDPKRYTIEQWYTSTSTHEPPLPSGKAVTLGMGSDRAFDFTLSPGELSSSGFLKLFVTNECIDLGWIQQEMSPFEKDFEGAGRFRPLTESLDLMSTRWDAVTVEFTITALVDDVNA